MNARHICFPFLSSLAVNAELVEPLIYSQFVSGSIHNAADAVSPGANGVVIGANVNNGGAITGSNKILIGTGDGTIRAQFDGTSWDLAGHINSPGAHFGTFPTAGPTRNFEYSTSGSAAFSAIYHTNYSSTAATDGARYIGLRARGSVNAPSAVLSGDELVRVGGRGYGATAFSTGPRASMQYRATENWTDTAQGSEILFYTTPNTTATAAVALTIGQDKLATFADGVTITNTLTASGAVAMSPANATVTASPTGTGTVTIAPATAGTINNMSIGATTQSTGRFTTLSNTGQVRLAGAAISGANIVNFVNTSALTSSTSQTALYIEPLMSTEATANINGVSLALGSPVTGSTMTGIASAMYKLPGITTTNAYSFSAPTPASSGTFTNFYAYWTNATNTSGYWAFYGAGTAPSYLGGSLQVIGATKSGGGSAGKATCWKADGVTIGYCSSAVDAAGACTCN